MTSGDIFTQALGLPEADRAALAQRLLLSLEPAEVDPEIDEVWQAEIESRLSRLESGEAVLSDWTEASARIRQALEKIRPS